MHTLFTPMGIAHVRTKHFPEWKFIRDGLLRNLGTVLRYHRKNPMAVNSGHFLVRLLGSISVPKSQQLERYYDNVDAISLNLSMALKMTSSIYKGQVFDGVFYGEGNREILLAHNEPFNVHEAHREWENVCAIKVLRHPYSDLGLNTPDGKQNGVEEGICVIAINIPMLAVQYRAFRIQEEYYASEEINSQRSVMQFLRMYALPNMLPSHLDYALFNRMFNLQTGAPMGATKKKHSFYLTDYSRNVDDFQSGIIANLDVVGRSFSKILGTIPLVAKESLGQAMSLPDVVPTRQVDWALSLARIPALHFLFSAGRFGPRTTNQQEVNQVLRSVLSYRTNNIFKSVLPLDAALDVQGEIDSIIAMST
jgi:hypothetical protein